MIHIKKKERLLAKGCERVWRHKVCLAKGETEDRVT